VLFVFDAMIFRNTVQYMDALCEDAINTLLARHAHSLRTFDTDAP